MCLRIPSTLSSGKTAGAPRAKYWTIFTKTHKKIQNPDDDDLYVPIQLHDKLVHHLEEDFVLINKKNKIIKLPAELNVVQILENFVRHFAANMTNTPIIGVRSVIGYWMQGSILLAIFWSILAVLIAG